MFRVLMGPFPSSYGNKSILLVVDYVPKRVEAIPIITCDAKVMLKFLCKHIFSLFGPLRSIVSDEGTHFCNKLFDSLLSKYGVRLAQLLPIIHNVIGKLRRSWRK